jgi:hypothetical protein
MKLPKEHLGSQINRPRLRGRADQLASHVDLRHLHRCVGGAARALGMMRSGVVQLSSSDRRSVKAIMFSNRMMSKTRDTAQGTNHPKSRACVSGTTIVRR